MPTLVVVGSPSATRAEVLDALSSIQQATLVVLRASDVQASEVALQPAVVFITDELPDDAQRDMQQQWPGSQCVVVSNGRDGPRPKPSIAPSDIRSWLQHVDLEGAAEEGEVLAGGGDWGREWPAKPSWRETLLSLVMRGLQQRASNDWFDEVATALDQQLPLHGCVISRTVDGREVPTITSGQTDAVHASTLKVPIGDDAGQLMLYLKRSLTSAEHQIATEAAKLIGAFFHLRGYKRTMELTEAKAGAILNTTVDAIVTIDEDAIIQSFNRAAERIFGYTEAEVLKKNVKVLMPEPYRAEHDDYVANYLETGKKRIIGIGREVHGRRKDGTSFPMDLAVSEVHLNRQRIFTGIIRDITERRMLEREVLQASDRERRRIGQDMHDGLGQMLTGLGLISQSLAKSLAAEGHEQADQMREIADLIQEADAYARGLARGLVPVELEMGGLTGALQRLADQAERLFGVDCVFEHTGEPSLGDSDVATHLYRIAQESLSNAVRHGKATQVDIQLRVTPKHVRLRVKDNGKGFPEPEVSPVTLQENEEMKRGMGIRIMNHRARIIGATLDIHGAPGEGTVVTCTRSYRRRSAPSAHGSEGTRSGGCPVHRS